MVHRTLAAYCKKFQTFLVCCRKHSLLFIACHTGYTLIVLAYRKEQTIIFIAYLAHSHKTRTHIKNMLYRTFASIFCILYRKLADILRTRWYWCNHLGQSYICIIAYTCIWHNVKHTRSIKCNSFLYITLAQIYSI